MRIAAATGKFPRRVAARARLWRWKILLRPSSGTIQRIKERKAERDRGGRSYSEHPTVSVIVQSFNQVKSIDVLEKRLRSTCADEFIVCEDGSVDGSHEEWHRRLVRPNDFLLRSNDIHEIRAYDRAISFARGDYICLMQDDDRPPKDGRWLARAIDVFNGHPELAILGCWCGFNDFFDQAYNAPWQPDGDGRIPFRDPHTGIPLVFVESVNIGPYLIRRAAYHEIGGFDYAFSPPGQPGITFESELCYRAWLHGYQVALTDVPVKLETGEETYILPGGTSLWGMDDRVRNERANKRRIEDLYAEVLPDIQEAVSRANRKLTGASTRR